MFALLPLLLSIAPEVARLIAGDKTGAATSAVTSAIQAITGTTDPKAAAEALAADEHKAADLRVALAKIAADAEAAERQAHLDEIKAYMGDTQDARKTTVALAASGSRLAWGAPIMSAVVLVSFASMLMIVLLRAVPDSSASIANVLLGTLAAMATQVANYWLGSSAGSASKQDLIRSLSQPSTASADDLNQRELDRAR